jgi:hypothetical protein
LTILSTRTHKTEYPNRTTANMKTFTAVAAAIAGLVSYSSAHMEMKDPPPFRSKFNKFTTDVDYSMTSPLAASGADFPCKGYHKLVGTPQAQSVVTWTPGQTYKMTITGGTPHNGGSCQASLSFDGGSTWKVIHSYVGNCPVMGESGYDFVVPTDTPAGNALFAWSWFNQVGNREMYMNCASVTIGGGSGGKIRKVRGVSDSINSRPAMFVANVGNGCSTAEGTDLLVPLEAAPSQTSGRIPSSHRTLPASPRALPSNPRPPPLRHLRALTLPSSRRILPALPRTLPSNPRPPPLRPLRTLPLLGMGEAAACASKGLWPFFDSMSRALVQHSYKFSCCKQQQLSFFDSILSTSEPVATLTTSIKTSGVSV